MAGSPFAHLRVLIVDDNGHMRQIIETALQAWSITNVFMAGAGAEALKLLRTVSIDLVLTDLNMDVLDGFEFVRMVRTADDSPNPYVPIIVVTGSTDAKTVADARDAGMTEFLAKPVSPKALYDRIFNVIQHPRPFIRAKRYFGPDRRRRSDESYNGPIRRECDAEADGAELSPERVAALLHGAGR